MSKLVEWPVLHEPESPYSEEYTAAELAYERARADAAMSRLRLAVEALKLYAHDGPYTYRTAHKALAEIGPLPDTAKDDV